MQLSRTLIAITCLVSLQMAHADVLPDAKVELKIPLAKKPTTRPMTVAYVPHLSRYYIADGGLAPMPGEMEIALSKSQVHVYDAKGAYLTSGKPGLDNRSIYFNPNTHKLESVIQAGSGAGMQTMDASLKDLVRRGVVSASEAETQSFDRPGTDRPALGREAA